MSIMKTLTINGVQYNVTPVIPASSVTLLASAWVRDGDTYSQVVEIPDVTLCTKVDLQPTSAQLVEFQDKNITFVTENDGGIITVYSVGDKPTGDHTIQITKTEVDGPSPIRGNTVGTPLIVTLEQIGAAPAGYGIGSNSKYITSDSDLNNLYTSGFYAYSYSSVPANGFTLDNPFQYVYHLHVLVDNNGTIVQEITTCGQGSKDANYRVRRVKGFGNWSEWEFENPPMVADVEYRTTERYDGKPVYAKVVSYYIDSSGAGSVGGVTDLAIPHGISNFGVFVGCDATCSIFPLPIRDGENKCVTVYSVDSSNITLRFINDRWSSAPFKFTLYYTKA